MKVGSVTYAWTMISMMLLACACSGVSQTHGGHVGGSDSLGDAPELTATVLGSRRIELRWEVDSSAATEFNIYRAFADTSGYFSLAEVGADRRTFLDETAQSGVMYRYKVMAVGDTWEATVDAFIVPFELVQLGTSEADYGQAVVADEMGNYYMAGVTKGSLEPGHENPNPSEYQIFLAKFNYHGELIWIRQFGTSEQDFVRRLALDDQGNVYGVGETRGSFPGFANTGDRDVIVFKFDSEGQQQWVRQFGSNEADLGRDIQVHADGQFYVVGSTRGTIPNEQGYMNPNANWDYFLSKHDFNGSVQWVVQGGSVGHDLGRALAIGPNDHIYVAGNTNGVLGEQSWGDMDLFVIRYSLEGIPISEVPMQEGSSSIDQLRAMAVGEDGSIYLAGGTYGDFGGSANGSENLFLARYGHDRTLQWVSLVQSVDGDGHPESGWAEDVMVGRDGSIYVTGSNPIGVAETKLIVLKYDRSSPDPLWMEFMGPPRSGAGLSIAEDPCGDIVVAGSRPVNEEVGVEAMLLKATPDGRVY